MCNKNKIVTNEFIVRSSITQWTYFVNHQRILILFISISLAVCVSVCASVRIDLIIILSNLNWCRFPEHDFTKLRHQGKKMCVPTNLTSIDIVIFIFMYVFHKKKNANERRKSMKYFPKWIEIHTLHTQFTAITCYLWFSMNRRHGWLFLRKKKKMGWIPKSGLFVLVVQYFCLFRTTFTFIWITFCIVCETWCLHLNEKRTCS